MDNLELAKLAAEMYLNGTSLRSAIYLVKKYRMEGLPMAISQYEGERKAKLFAKAVIEDNLTANEVAKKYNCTACTVTRYVKTYIKDENMVKQYLECMTYNKLERQKAENRTTLNAKYKHIKPQELHKFYSKYCLEKPKVKSIMLGAAVANTTEEIAEQEYKKWRNEYVTSYGGVL